MLIVQVFVNTQGQVKKPKIIDVDEQCRGMNLQRKETLLDYACIEQRDNLEAFR